MRVRRFFWAAIGAVFAVVATGAAAERLRREVRFASEGATMAATLYLPATASSADRVPGLVIIPGSGASSRDNAWARAVAEAMAARGMAVLFPDKRGTGESGGDWRTAAFDTLAADALAAIALMRRERAIDPGAIGILGLSQGGFIAPMAAARDPGVAFAMSLSASMLPVWQATYEEVERQAKRGGLPAAMVERVNAVHRLAIVYGRSGEGWEAYSALLQRELSGDMAGMGLFEPFPRERTDWRWNWNRLNADFDPLAHWRALERPRFIVYGADDEYIDVAVTLARFYGEGFTPGDVTVQVYGDSGHALYAPGSQSLRPEMLDAMAAWIVAATED